MEEFSLLPVMSADAPDSTNNLEEKSRGRAGPLYLPHQENRGRCEEPKL